MHKAFYIALITFTSLLTSLLASCPTGSLLVTDTGACVNVCPSTYYLPSNQPLCVPQIVITTRLQSTPSESTFLLFFDGDVAPFSTNAHLVNNISITIATSDTDPIENVTDFVAEFLDEEKHIARIYTRAQVIAPGANLSVEFPTFTPDQEANSFYIVPDSLNPAAYAPLSSVNSNLVDALTDFDLVLEIAWTALTLFNPYAFLYMNAKFYRETFDLLKQVDVQYEPFLAKFLKINNNKVSGFKLPNALSIIIYGNPVNSGWDRQDEVVLQYTTLQPARVEDLNMVASNRLYEFEPFCLFLDNYGIQLTVLVLCLAIVGVFEIIRKLFKPAKTETQISNDLSVFQALRTTFRWNLCIATVIGSYQSLMYYSMVQFKAFLSSDNEKTGHNIAGFLIALFSFMILGVGLPAYLFLILRRITRLKKDRVLASEHYRYEELINCYGIFCKFYNIDRINYPIFILVWLFRSFIFALLILVAEDSPSLQLGLMIGFSLAFALYMLVLWPFKKFIYNLLQLLYEAVLFAMMSLLLLLSSVDNKDSNSLHRQVVSYLILSIWCVLPLLSAISGLVGLALIFFGPVGKKADVVSVAPEPVNNNDEAKKEYVASAGTSSTVARLNERQLTGRQEMPVPSIEEVMSEHDEENPRIEDVNNEETRPSRVVLEPRRYFF